jgi:hypothetical protein
MDTIALLDGGEVSISPDRTRVFSHTLTLSLTHPRVLERLQFHRQKAMHTPRVSEGDMHMLFCLFFWPCKDTRVFEEESKCVRERKRVSVREKLSEKERGRESVSVGERVSV